MRRKCKNCIAGLAIILACGCIGCKTEDKTVSPEGGTKVPEMVESGEESITPDTEVTGYEKYSEAPMLQTLVQARELLAVEQRLPVKEDIVTETMDSIGAYCASVQFAAENADSITGNLVSEGLFRYAQDGTIVPNIAKAYTVNADFTQYTISLREGLRWSDGVLFTSDDCIFFYERLCLPETFGEPLWECFKVYDAFGRTERAVFTKVDEVTFQVTFPSSKPEFLEQLLMEGGICFAPEHYHVNLLPAYMGEDAAAAKAREMGYEDVAEMLKKTVVNAWNTPGVPTLNPYCIAAEEDKNDVDGDYYEFVRNPYYWKIDAAGKQLPYLDRLCFTRISDESQKMLLTTEGFLSISPLTAEQVADAKASAVRGNYRVITWTNFSSYAVKNAIKNFPEQCPYEEKSRGIGAAHAECWYIE